MTDPPKLPPMWRAANLSPDGLHRYELTREWSEPDGPQRWICFCGLNPSKADGLIDDPTIRREIDFARRIGANAMIKINLCSWRATHQSDLRLALERFGYATVSGGAANRQAIVQAVELARGPGGLGVVAAWGAGVSQLSPSLVSCCKQLLGLPLLCLGRTKDGFPRHPVRLAKSTQLEEFTLA